MTRQAWDEAASLPKDGADALRELLDAMALAPDNFLGADGANMPAVPFGPRKEGLVSVLIWEPERILYVTRVQWAG